MDANNPYGWNTTMLRRTEWGAKARARDNAEARFQKQVEELAVLKRWWCWHVYDSRRTSAGLPDLICLRERVIFIELKATSLLTNRTGKLSPVQERVQEMLEAANAETYVITDSKEDWKRLQKVLA